MIAMVPNIYLQSKMFVLQKADVYTGKAKIKKGTQNFVTKPILRS